MADDPQPESPFAPGEVIEGKYEVVRPLGAGGMGIVLLAKHRGLDELVAIKLLQKHALANPQIVPRFVQEARAAAKIKGEHCVRMLDVAQLANGAPYMVMEYLEGVDLQRYIESHGRMPAQAAVDLVLEACAAIAEAHRRGIVHRDLKASNLFLVQRDGAEGLLKVLDFGISKVLPHAQVAKGALTKSSDVFGSPLYMSPEQMRDSGSLDHRTDIWSLGVILYETITGQLPFTGESMPVICAAVLTEPPAPMPASLPGIPPGLADVVMRCLEKDPASRYPSVAAFAEALLPFAGRRGKAARDKVVASAATAQSDPHAVGLAIDSAPTLSDGGTNFGLTTRTRTRSSLLLASLAGIGAGAIILAIIAVTGMVRARHARATTAVSTSSAASVSSEPAEPPPPMSPSPEPSSSASAAPAIELGDDPPVGAAPPKHTGRDAGAAASQKRKPTPSPRKSFGGRD